MADSMHACLMVAGGPGDTSQINEISWQWTPATWLYLAGYNAFPWPSRITDMICTE
jgi:hypothetical protein